MSTPDRQQYLDNILGDVAIAYYQMQENFIAPQVFPVVPVDKQEAKYYTFDQNDNLRDEMRRRPNATESAGSGFNLSSDSYHCDVWALHKDITDRDRKNWNFRGQSLDDSTVQWLMQMGLQRMERQWMTDFFTTGIWGADVVPSPKWDVYGTSDPLADVDTAKTAVLGRTGFDPNVLVLGFQVWQKLKRHPLIVDRVSGGSTTANPALVTRNTVAALFEVEKILVAKAIKATNLENETAALDFIAGKSALLAYVPSNPSLVTPSAGYTFQWRLDSARGETVGVYRIPTPLLGVGTERLEIEKAWDNKVTGAGLGQFLSAVIS